jgi:hypothetical protein
LDEVLSSLLPFSKQLPVLRDQFSSELVSQLLAITLFASTKQQEEH